MALRNAWRVPGFGPDWGLGRDRDSWAGGETKRQTLSGGSRRPLVRFGSVRFGSCDALEPVSTLFGAPVTANGAGTLLEHRFGALEACPNTRIETFANAVRQRIGGEP
jgi:hypothetical protein